MSDAATTTRILVVDDEEPTVQLLEDLLAGVGYEVATAYSGREAIERLEGEAFALVLTDVTMPGVTGWDVCAHVRDRGLAVPVVLVTGAEATLDPEQAKAAGVAAVIAKPFDIDPLLRCVERTLARPL